MAILNFGHEGLVVPQALTADAIAQMNLMSVFAKSASGGFGKGAFEKGATVNFRRMQISEAEDYDPNSGAAARSDDLGYVNGSITLNHLFTLGVPRKAADYNNAKYIEEAGQQLAFAITKPFDNALYSTFRTPTHASTGPVQYGVHMPLRVVVAEDSSGKILPFQGDLLVNAGASLEEENVPTGDMYAILSTRAKAAYLGEQIPLDAGAVWAALGVQSLVQKGFPIGVFVPRLGFMVGGSNTIRRNLQNRAVDLDAAGGNEAALPIDSMANNPDFTKADNFSSTLVAATSLGAIDFTLTCTALQNVAVGQIARIGPDDAKATAYGVVLRVVGKVVTLVPFSLEGEQLEIADLALTDQFSIPKIPSVNIGYKKQALIFDTREMEAPPEGAGATMTGAKDDETGVLIQYWTGSYDVDTFKSKTRASLLCGTKLTDYRQACFMLSA